MLKKKNIAMVMAATTVVTSVAPVFAAETQNLDEAALIAQVEKMLNTKYSDAKEDGDNDSTTNTDGANAYRNSVYQITYTKDGNITDLKSVSELKTLIENAKIKGGNVTLTVTDKGHKEVDGKIVASEKTKKTYYTTTSLADLQANADTNPAKQAITSIVNDTAKNTTTITLKNKQEIVLTTSDYVLDFNSPVDANGNVIDLTVVVSEDVAKRVVGFKTVEGTTESEIDIPSKQLDTLVYEAAASKVINYDLASLVGEDGYTQTGKELVEFLGDANTGNGTVGVTSIVQNGKKYNVKFIKSSDLSQVEAVKGAGYKLTVSLEVVEAGEQFAATPKPNTQLVITSSSQANLVSLRNAIDNADSSTVITTGKINKLAGDNRFETAVEVSKESYPTNNGSTTAQGVVLVGEDAIVDGLASAPLATAKQAPILLTKKDEVPAETMKEIKRLVSKGQDIFIVGGTSVISKEVEAQLIKEMNANIIRLAGDDRSATSLEVAKEIGAEINGTAYVVGADGEADAMSIAAVAAKDTDATANVEKVSPIIVTPADGLTKDAKAYLAQTTNVTTNVDVIGGESKISTQVLKDIDKVKTTSILGERVAGSTRHETNAEVITKYFKTNPTTVEKIVVAKDGYAEGNGKLIDALTVAPLAASKNAPIVLATDDLTAKQNTELKNAIKTTGATSKELVQAGNGVSTTVTQKLLKLLGL